MANILNISQAASLALHTMARLAAHQEGPLTNRRLAEELVASKAHLAKVTARLGRAGLLVARRGPQGGLSLAADPKRITLLQIYEAVEGPLPSGGCLLPQPVCSGHCILGDLLHRLSREVRHYLGGTHLADIIQSQPCEVIHESVA